MRPPVVTAMLIAVTIPASVASAQMQDPATPRIVVSGAGDVSTPPDRVALTYGVHGEGATSDEAVTAMVAKRKAIDGGLAGFAARPEARTTQASIQEVRGRDCNRPAMPYGAPKLSTGECAIIGYTADLTMEVRTAAVKDAGTIVGLIGRLGGTNPRIERFFLADDTDARRRATAAALADAKRQAEAIAAGSGVSLGHLLSVSNTNFLVQPFADIVVSASAPLPPPPPPAAPPAIAVELKPRPIETQMRVQVVYAIGS